MTVRCGWVRAMCSTIGSTVVIPAPALASSSGPSEGWTTKSPAGRADVEPVADRARSSCRKRRDLAVGGAPDPADPAHRDLQAGARGRSRRPCTAGAAGWPSGRSTKTETYCPGLISGQRTAVGRLEHQGDDVGGLLVAARPPGTAATGRRGRPRPAGRGGPPRRPAGSRRASRPRPRRRRPPASRRRRAPHRRPPAGGGRRPCTAPAGCPATRACTRCARRTCAKEGASGSTSCTA